MYFNNAFGGQGGASALTSPPDNTLAGMLQQQQQRQPMMPTLPQNGQRQMAGAGGGMPNLSPSPLPGSSGLTSQPQSADLMSLLQKYGIGGGGQGGQGGGLGGLMGGQGGGDNSGLLKQLQQWLGMSGSTGGGPSVLPGMDFGGGSYGR